jgi:hypothetical protein
VAGEIVANGFAIEIEGRGLGMTLSRTAEFNEQLSNPPDTVITREKGSVDGE